MRNAVRVVRSMAIRRQLQLQAFSEFFRAEFRTFRAGWVSYAMVSGGTFRMSPILIRLVCNRSALAYRKNKTMTTNNDSVLTGLKRWRRKGWVLCSVALMSAASASLVTARVTHATDAKADSGRVFELEIYHVVRGRCRRSSRASVTRQSYRRSTV